MSAGSNRRLERRIIRKGAFSDTFPIEKISLKARGAIGTSNRTRFARIFTSLAFVCVRVRIRCILAATIEAKMIEKEVARITFGTNMNPGAR